MGSCETWCFVLRDYVRPRGCACQHFRGRSIRRRQTLKGQSLRGYGAADGAFTACSHVTPAPRWAVDRRAERGSRRGVVEVGVVSQKNWLQYRCQSWPHSPWPFACDGMVQQHARPWDWRRWAPRPLSRRLNRAKQGKSRLTAIAPAWQTFRRQERPRARAAASQSGRSPNHAPHSCPRPLTGAGLVYIARSSSLASNMYKRDPAYPDVMQRPCHPTHDTHLHYHVRRSLTRLP